jgi:hypothetical protein
VDGAGALDPDASRRIRGDVPLGITGGVSPLSWATLVLLLGLTATDAMLVRGHITTFWGDYALWLHEVERFAQGQVPYRDFYFAAPPLSIWLVGSAAKALGTDVSSAFNIMTVVFVTIMISYWLYVVQLLPSRLVPIAVLSGFVLAVAYATIESAPLALGMHKPAMPIGFLCLMVTLVFGISYSLHGGLWRASLVGGAAALCILAKQDFWAPALAAVIGVSWVRTVPPSDRRGVGLLLITFALTVTGGVGLVVTGAGVDSLPGVATGSGMATEILARALPSWRLVTVETIAAVLLSVGFVGCLLLTRVRVKRVVRTAAVLFLSLTVLTTIYVGFEDRAGFNVATFRELRDTVYWHLFPAMLPVLVLAMVALSRNEGRSKQLRGALILLGVVCIAARIRRGFEHVEWYHFLLELPVYILAVEFFLGRTARRATVLAVAGLAMIGANVHFRFGVGPLSVDGQREITVTPRGPVRWDPWNTQEFRAVQQLLKELDPSGQRSVFQFGSHNGTLNYFLKHPTTTSITEGFVYATHPDEELADLLRTDPPLFLVYDHMYDGNQVPSLRIEWSKWNKSMQRSRHAVYDAPYFNRLKADCSPVTLLVSRSQKRVTRRWPELTVRWHVGEYPGRAGSVGVDGRPWPRITVYDCARRGDLERIVAEVNGRSP